MFLDTHKLFSTILHSKAINTQLEDQLFLSALEVDSCQTSPKPFQANNRKSHINENIGDQNDRDEQEHSDEYKNIEVHSSIGPMILQFTLLEDTNFKDQFFVTRSSFQVIIYFK